MKSNSSFPHPVLGINKGVLPDLDETALQVKSVEENDTHFVYTFNLHQSNVQITEYIKQKYAKYLCEVDCNKSFFKETFDSDKEEIVVKIKKTDVIGHIDFSFYIVTTCRFPNYRNNNFNSDYKDFKTGKFPSFDLETGAVLVMFPQWSDNVNTRFNNKPELNAFIQVVKRTDIEQNVEIDLGDDIINVGLPEKLFSDFIEYNRDLYKGLFYTTLIFHALVKAILNLEKNEGSLWADSIKAIIESTPEKYKGLSLDDPLDAVDIATIMLSHQEYGSMYDLLFSSIKNLQN